MTHRQSGFTLVEILLSLVILAFAAILLADTFGASASAFSRLNKDTQAWLVASDKLVELQVFQQWPATGTQDEIVERGGQRWQVRTRTTEGPYPNTRRVDIEVGLAAEGGGWQPNWSQFSLLAKPHESIASPAGSSP
ncbi:MAG: type II secretion system protein GspI [Gammaproteobacteria bacterium HGW-Gammaproteobacteria-14]|nr:MAG: type II secretion system protein GspI [Gammaproteobacteria bacterium HGW-Gammaproteobacteria-14]